MFINKVVVNFEYGFASVPAVMGKLVDVLRVDRCFQHGAQSILQRGAVFFTV